jgi:uncharacterized membrane protein
MLLAMVTLLGTIGPQRASALPTFPPVVTATYKLKPGGILSKAVANCTFCHVVEGPPKRNPYGADLEAALKQAQTKTLTPDILKSIENKDSDGDGFTNAAEIAADTLPGDPSSKPTGQPNATPQAASTSSAPAESDAGPFALKTLMFPSHAQHRVLVHFPIALLVISLIFDVLGYLKKNPALTTAAYYNLIVAGVTAPLTVATGLLAWIFAFGQAPLQGFLLYHLILGVTAMLLIWALWWVRARNQGRLEGAAGRAYVILGILSFMVISLTGHLGGWLTLPG